MKTPKLLIGASLLLFFATAPTYAAQPDCQADPNHPKCNDDPPTVLQTQPTVIDSLGQVVGVAMFDPITQGADAASLPASPPPSGLLPGDEYRLVFITAGLITATSGDISTYNDFVANEANSVPELAALSTTWRAIGSTTQIDAKINTQTDDPGAGIDGVPIFRLDGLIVASDYDDLWDGSIQNPIIISPDGNEQTCCTWTGTTASGLSGGVSSLGNENVIDANPTFTNPSWVQTSPFVATTEWSLYGISGVLAVPPVPAPGAGAVLIHAEGHDFWLKMDANGVAANNPTLLFAGSGCTGNAYIKTEVDGAGTPLPQLIEQGVFSDGFAYAPDTSLGLETIVRNSILRSDGICEETFPVSVEAYPASQPLVDFMDFSPPFRVTTAP